MTNTYKVARNYCLYAFILFAFQGVVALLGAADLVLPRLPSPVPYSYGKSIHLGLANFWPLVGTIGMVYYFLVREIKVEIYSLKLARLQFWLILTLTLGLLGSLAFQIGNGREYFEGLPIFYAGIAISIGLGSYNLVRTLLANKQGVTPSSIAMTSGMILLCLFMLPNSLNYKNPIVDEAVKFWVVHLWEEMCFELTTTGFVASFFVTSGLATRQNIEKWLYLEVALAVVAGLFGTGHHYYWIGFPAYWLVLGFAFSILQVIPVILLLYLTYKGIKDRRPPNNREKLTLVFIVSSMFHHATGASLLGLVMAVPWINLYSHGTYITSAHAHLALFGSLGFLVLGGCYYIISVGEEPTRKRYLIGVFSVLLLNFGIIAMSTSLLFAGLIQSYLWRYLGIDHIEVQRIILPLLAIRVLGGMFYTAGDLILSWRILKTWRETKSLIKT